MVKISIVTATLNRLDFLRKCTHSVLDQGYEYVEHVVVDGGSTDGTVEFLASLSRKYGDRIRWVSGRDEGISHAINKGLTMATGDVIGWMGSDDSLLEGALRTVSGYFRKHPEIQWLYGSYIIVDDKGRTIRKMRAKPFNHTRFIRSAYGNVCGPCVFARRELVNRIGPVRLDLKFTMDYEWCLRLAALARPGRVDQFLGYFGWHEGSITRMRRLAQLDEGKRVSQAYAGGGVERAWIATIYKFQKGRAWARRRLIGVLRGS